jgi:L-alanine-DL-glutamate epimerase-like enolase superfamily enzyme
VKITGVETYPVWSGQRNLLFVLVDTDEGIYGVGEAGLTGRELAVTGTIEHFEPLLVGEDPFRTEHLWQLLFRGGFFPARHAISAAISAVDIALWDIKGKTLGVPVYELLGGRARDRVVCYPHNAEAGMDTSALVESCLKTKEEGWRFVRWGLPQEGEIFRPYRSVLAAVEQLGAVRDAVGEEVEMILDVHTRLDMPDSLWLCREVESLRPYFIEDPLRSEDPRSYEMLRLAPASARAPGTGRRVRSGGGEVSSVSDGGASAPAPPGRLDYELVSRPFPLRRASATINVRKCKITWTGFQTSLTQTIVKSSSHV